MFMLFGSLYAIHLNMLEEEIELEQKINQTVTKLMENRSNVS